MFLVTPCLLLGLEASGQDRMTVDVEAVLQKLTIAEKVDLLSGQWSLSMGPEHQD